jgi:ferredoxin
MADSSPFAPNSVQIRFLPNDVLVTAAVGEPLLQVADRAGVMIPTGCLMGSCHACEVELADGEAICACISAVPPSEEEMTISLFVDPTW